MADNVELNSGTGGAVIAADDISSVWHQRVKVQHGADGSATDVSSASPLPVIDRGASSHYRNVDANAEAQIKGSSCILHWLVAINRTASIAYLHLYDALAASVTPGTTTPDFTFPIPTQGDTNGSGFVLPKSHTFTTGLTLVVTTTIDGSAGDPGTNGVFINAGYE